MISRVRIPLVLLALALATPLAAQRRIQEEGRTTFRGVVVDAANDDPLPNTIVLLVDEHRGTLTDSLGRFSFTNVPVGPQLIAVKQYGYDESDIDLDVMAEQDPVRIELKPGPLAMEGFTVLADHLATMNRNLTTRRNAYGGSVRALDQSRLADSGASDVMDFLGREGALHFMRCGNGAMSTACVMRRGSVTEPKVYIDEARVFGGLEFLAMFRPYELYLVEVYSGGREVRAYTHWFMERMAAKPEMLFPLEL